METKTIGPFLGLNTQRADSALATETGRFLSRCENVDIDDEGVPVRRRGVSRVAAMTGAHSLKMRTATKGFLVRASVLYDITLPDYTETLVQVLTSNAAMSYAKMGTDWYFSNGTDSGRFTDGIAYPLGLPTPAAPTASVIGGALNPGQYKILTAYANATTGEEGGMSEPLNMDAENGIRVTLPGVVDGATHVNVYVSDPNGTAALLHTSVAIGTATLDVIDKATGRVANARFEDKLPNGTLFTSNGRLCSFAGTTVYVGLPYRPGYYDPVAGFIPFTEDVTIAIENQNGTYIVSDQTYYIPGDLGNVQEAIKDVLPYGAVPGTAFRAPNSQLVGWFSARGFVLADTLGQIDATMADRVRIASLPTYGAASVCECGGYRRVSGCGYSMNIETKAVSTYTDWDFTSLSNCFGTKADGVYKTDTDDVVTAAIGLGKLDFGSDKIKYMPVLYLGATVDLVATVTTSQGTYSYTSSTFGTGLTQRRVIPGKGLLSNWFDVVIGNTNGVDFRLSTIGFAPLNTERRI